MDGIDPDSVWLICPAFADELIGGQTLESLETAAIIVDARSTVLSPDASRPVPGNRNRQLGCTCQNCLFRRSATPVAATLQSLFFQILVRLRVQDRFRKCLLQFVEKAVPRKQLLGVTSSQKLVQKFLVDCHRPHPAAGSAIRPLPRGRHRSRPRSGRAKPRCRRSLPDAP